MYEHDAARAALTCIFGDQQQCRGDFVDEIANNLNRFIEDL